MAEALANAAEAAGRSDSPLLARALEGFSPEVKSAVLNTYAAYNDGRMSSEQSQAFEADVRAGKVLLPRGATLKSDPGAPVATDAAANIYAAYAGGQMSPQQRADYERDVRAGVMPLPPGAKLAEEPGLGAQIKEAFTGDARQTRATRELPELPGSDVLRDAGLSPATAARLAAVLLLTPNVEEAGQIIRAASPDLAIAQDERGNLIVANNRTGRQAVLNKPGLTEMDVLQGLGLGTAFAPVGPGGAVTLLGKVGTMVAKSAAVQTGIEGAQAASGGEFNPSDVAIAGAVGGVVPPAAAVLEKATAAAPAVLRDVAALPGKAADALPAPVRRVLGREEAPPAGTVPTPAGGAAAPSPGTLGSAGSAGTDAATLRRTAAESLPEPIKLTEGQATRDQAQLRFEGETAKDPVQGARLRERFDEQTAKIHRNLDAFVDGTGAEAPDVVAAGKQVVETLGKQAEKERTAIRVAYKEAEKAGEMRAPIDTTPVVDVLNANVSAEALAPVLKAARAELIRLGGAAEDASGTLVARDLALGDMEAVRKLMVKGAGADPTNIKFAADVKRAIDAATEGAGGDLYKKARAMRAEFARQYEDRAIVSDLLNTKRGTADAKVAAENVFRRTILNGSADDIAFLKQTLGRAGEDGAQSWRELQGQTMAWLREQATRSVNTTQRGDTVISAAGLDRAVKQLDKNGRLDLVLGKRQASMVRDLNEIAKHVNTVPPGTLNTSNTASVVLRALAEAGVVGSMTGLPVPVLSGLKAISKSMADRKVATRVSQALGEAQKTATKSAAKSEARERATLRAMAHENAAKPPKGK